MSVDLTFTRRARWVRRTARSLLSHLVLIALGLMFMFPLLWMLSTALKPREQIFTVPPTWVPRPMLWSNFIDVLSIFPFFLYLKNTLFYCAIAIIGTVASSCIVAYSFARIRWWGRNILFLTVLATMMVPGQVTMIPLYILFSRLGWVGSFKPLLIPAFFGNAFFIFLLRQFFLTIPQELSDAAKIDGSSEVGILLRIILPLSQPAIFTVVLFEFLGRWNDFMGPLIYLSDTERYTLSIGLQNLLGPHFAAWNLLMAGSSLTVVPILILYFFTQRTFVQGITLTGMKE